MCNDNEHEHAPTTFGHAFAIGIALNTAYVVIEVIYGVASNSLALLADAGHNLSDVLGLAVAWGAAVLTLRPPSQRYTYGLRVRFEIQGWAFLRMRMPPMATRIMA